MASTTKVVKATNTATSEDTLVVISPKVQKAVKALAQAHAVEKQIDTAIKDARSVILSELDFGVTVIGTDARGKRLVKVQVIESNTAKYDTKAMLDFITKTHPEMLDAFLLPAGKPTVRVQTI